MATDKSGLKEFSRQIVIGKKNDVRAVVELATNQGVAICFKWMNENKQPFTKIIVNTDVILKGELDDAYGHARCVVQAVNEI